MDSRPFLDKISTSAHLPPKPGQRGFCSVKTFPDLSHTYIRTKFDKGNPSSSTPDGRMTKEFTMRVKRKICTLHRGIAVLDAKEAAFKVDHKNYIDKLLLDMEATRMDQSQRRMAHWDSTKTGLGFSDKFNYTGESERTRGTGAGTFVQSSEAEGSFETYSEDGDHQDTDDEAKRSPKELSNGAVRFNEENLAATASFHEDSVSLDRSNSVSSVPSYMNSMKSGSRRHNRMAVFNDLLERTEVKSPIKRFGSVG